jgi:hypothetical protein
VIAPARLVSACRGPGSDSVGALEVFVEERENVARTVEDADDFDTAGCRPVVDDVLPMGKTAEPAAEFRTSAAELRVL